jgi:hypothetical protein
MIMTAVFLNGGLLILKLSKFLKKRIVMVRKTKTMLLILICLSNYAFYSRKMICRNNICFLSSFLLLSRVMQKIDIILFPCMNY